MIAHGLATGSLFESPSFRKAFVWSAAVHLAALAAALIGVPSLRTQNLPPPVFVQVLAAAPAAAPAPPPQQELKQPVVIPKQAPKAKPKPKPKAKPKPKPKPKAKAAPAPPGPSKDDILAKLRQNVQARTGTKTAAVDPSLIGGPGRVDPLLALYRRKVIALLDSNFSSRGFAASPNLRAQYEVQITSAGGVREVTLVSSSGNRFFDETAERAIRKSPFPAPPRGDLTLDVTFQPGTVF